MLRRAWSVLLFDFLRGILFSFGFLPCILFRFGFCLGKEDPKDIAPESLVCPFDFLPGILFIFGFLPCILFRFGFCSGKEDPKDYLHCNQMVSGLRLPDYLVLLGR